MSSAAVAKSSPSLSFFLFFFRRRRREVSSEDIHLVVVDLRVHSVRGQGVFRNQRLDLTPDAGSWFWLASPVHLKKSSVTSHKVMRNAVNECDNNMRAEHKPVGWWWWGGGPFILSYPRCIWFASYQILNELQLRFIMQINPQLLLTAGAAAMTMLC